ncbi:hypothetical protein IFR05_014372 [Cadophora sp. M221]|nr:hypothetical protein IFR05_014372 [Cadophora sp. M221]
MPPRIPRVVVAQSRSIRLSVPPNCQQICPICSVSRTLRNRSRRPGLPQLQQPRIQALQRSNLSSASNLDRSSSPPPKPPRIELRDALLDIQKHASSYVNISRLQLALRGLEQGTGDETIRIAILGIADGGASLKKAKELLRLLVADPLKTEEEWERILLGDEEGGRPIFLKVGQNGAEETLQGNRLVRELHVSSPTLNGHKLEILVLEMDPPTTGSGEGEFTEAVLVPTMEIPTSNSGRYTPVTTPVHKSLIVSEGILGAASVLNYPTDVDQAIISTAVDLKADSAESLPFQVVDVSLATGAIRSFRKSVDNALLYEKNWFASGMPEVLEWVRYGTASTAGEMKHPLRKLVESLLNNVSLAIQAEKSRQLGLASSKSVPSLDLLALREGLAVWAETAHTELRDELDVAFNGQRWRKLGWWKLFWRVDDVSMISSDILGQRFLTNAEKEVIYLAGCIAQAGVLKNTELSPKNWAYKPVEATLGAGPQPPKIRDLVDTPKDLIHSGIKPQPWPLHIPVTRAYLSQETIPALQALAQKLVFQTLSTSSLASAFAGLMYFSSITTTLYEAGGVAAFGIVWSLKRMQGKWETARKFWEGEVREEGRKAVRAVEGVVGKVLKEKKPALVGDYELEKAKETVARAHAALKASSYHQVCNISFVKIYGVSAYWPVSIMASAATEERDEKRPALVEGASWDGSLKDAEVEKQQQDGAAGEKEEAEDLSEEDGEASEGEAENEEQAASSASNPKAADAPPLPNEDIPPLPAEPPPAATEEDDGWAPLWEETAQAFYFYNRFTGATQWTNPRVPEVAQPGPPGVEAPLPAEPTAAAPPPVTGYNPAIHGDYDPTAWYAQPTAPEPAPGQATDPASQYTATAAFNRFTGRYQAADLNPENFNDENKSKRQMNAFFDVDAAANSHDGRSLKAERSGKKISKTELKQFKEKRKQKKEEKRRAWLRD